MTPIIRLVETRSILTPTKIPGSDYAANPYIGCTHACKYCYACFMKRFANHPEPWGEFLDVKFWPAIKHPGKYKGKRVLIGTVTDPYLPQEAKYGRTRSFLEEMRESGAQINILTKSHLVLRDLDLLRQIPAISVAFSINTLDEKFRRDMDRTPPIQRRLEAMQKIHAAGIPTATFISPIFPGITDAKAIMDAVKDKCDEVWLENLNLRGEYLPRIMAYIKANYPHLLALYQQIYIAKDRGYWFTLAKDLDAYAVDKGIKLTNYFYHEEIRKP